MREQPKCPRQAKEMQVMMMTSRRFRQTKFGFLPEEVGAASTTIVIAMGCVTPPGR